MTPTDEWLKRITVRPDVVSGKPTIRNMRIAVEHVFAMMAAGDTPDATLHEHDFLEPADIQACFLYAYRSLVGEQVHGRLNIGKQA